MSTESSSADFFMGITRLEILRGNATPCLTALLCRPLSLSDLGWQQTARCLRLRWGHLQSSMEAARWGDGQLKRLNLKRGFPGLNLNWKRHDSGLMLGKNHPQTMQLRHTIKSESYLSATRLAWRTLEYPAPTPYASLGDSRDVSNLTIHRRVGFKQAYLHIAVENKCQIYMQKWGLIERFLYL